MPLIRAARRLGRTPVFTAATVLILMLAVGACTTAVGLLRALVWRPLPVPEAHELVHVATRDALGRDGDLTWGQFNGLLAAQRVFSTVIGSITQGTVTVDTRRGPQRCAIAGVTPGYFAELGARPALGRLITADDLDLATARSEPVVVLGWRFWRRHFAGDPRVIGQSLTVEGLPLTIVGVAPAGFLGLGITLEADVIVPLTLIPRLLESEAALLRGTARWVGTMGRLAPGVSLAAARAQLSAIWPAVRGAATPMALDDGPREAYRQLRLDVSSGARGVERGLRDRYTRPLYVLVAMAALLVLVAAINLCSLAFVKLDAGRHELGIRLALGATRRRLVIESLGPGLLVGAAGAVGGLLVARVASRAIVDVLLADYLVPAALDVSPDWPVAGAALGVGMGTGLAMMAAATWMAASPGLPGPPAGSRAVTRSTRLGRMLVATQAALSMVVVSQSSILGRHVQRLNAPDGALTADPLLVGTPTARVGAYRDLPPDRYYREALDRVRAVPGVSAAAFMQHRPQRGAVPREPVGPVGAAAGERMAEVTLVSPGTFETLGLPLVDGRDVTFDDRQGTPRVAIVSRSLAQELFGDARAVGQRIRLAMRPDWPDAEVIGVAQDATLFDLRGGQRSIVYLPALQAGRLAHFKVLVVRGSPSLSRAVEQALESVGVETIALQTLTEARGRTLLQERLLAWLSGTFGLVTLVLVAAGTHGLLAYVLSLRRKEIGIRLALGADARVLARGVVRAGLVVVLVGIGAGLGGAWLVARALERVLAGMPPPDPTALATAGGLLILAGGLASLAPAWRARRVDPLSELRRE